MRTLPSAHDRLDPIAVPLDLEQPVRVAERLRGERRQHRLDVRRHRRLDGAGQVDLGGRRRRLPIHSASRSALTSSLVRPVLTLCGMVLGVPAGHRGLVALVDEQPLIAAVVLLEGSRARVVALALPAARPHDREAALQLLAVEAELQLAGLDRRGGVERGRLGLPGAPVPDDDVAGAVLPGPGSRPRSRSTRSGGPRRGWPSAAGPGSRVGPRGTAHETRTPSTSSRKS